MDGSQVAAAVEDGRINEVAEYGRKEVLATFQCLQATWPLIDP
jgi:hypothetical protein